MYEYICQSGQSKRHILPLPDRLAPLLNPWSPSALIRTRWKRGMKFTSSLFSISKVNRNVCVSYKSRKIAVSSPFHPWVCQVLLRFNLGKCFEIGLWATMCLSVSCIVSLFLFRFNYELHYIWFLFSVLFLDLTMSYCNVCVLYSALSWDGQKAFVCLCFVECLVFRSSYGLL